MNSEIEDKGRVIEPVIVLASSRIMFALEIVIFNSLIKLIK